MDKFALVFNQFPCIVKIYGILSMFGGGNVLAESPDLFPYLQQVALG